MERQTKKNNNKFRARAKTMASVLSTAIIISAAGAAMVSQLTGGGYVPTASAHCSTAPSDKPFVRAKLPHKSGGTLIYAAEGATSNGSNWSYTGDSDCALVRCDYSRTTGRYHFFAEGVHAGTCHVTLLYQTDDDNWETRTVTVCVGDDLRVTVAQEDPRRLTQQERCDRSL